MEASQQSHTFVERQAFLGIQAKGFYDMMSCGRNVRNKIVATNPALLKGVPPLPFPADQFWDKIAHATGQSGRYSGGEEGAGSKQEEESGR